MKKKSYYSKLFIKRYILFVLVFSIIILMTNCGENSSQVSLLPAEDIITGSENIETSAKAEAELPNAPAVLEIAPESITMPETASLTTVLETAAPATTQPPTTGLTGYYTRTYDNGDTYTGEFKNGVRSGQGKYTWANGTVYTGEWLNGNPTGNGTYTFPPPPATAAPPPATEPSAPQYISDSPGTDFIQYMFDTSIKIPGTENRIEPPPEGRSLELQYRAVPLSENIPEPFEYFRNIIFLGDSVTMGFDLFRSSITFNGNTVLRDTNVVAVGSFGVFRAAQGRDNLSLNPFFKGQQDLPENLISTIDAKYVLICLGLNDLGMLTLENYIALYSSLIERIQAKNPDKTVVIMPVTPLVFSGQRRTLHNEAVTNANNALLQLAIDKDIPFLDYAAAIRDRTNNALYDSLSSDAYCHLTVAAYNRLIEYMLYHPLQ
jgi:lysophospholipase L1-like esterase